MSVTVEDVLAGLSAHGPQGDFRKPDPLVMEKREELVGPPRFELLRFFTRDRMPRKIRTAKAYGTRSAKRPALQDIIADALSGMPRKSWVALLTAEHVDAHARELMIDYLLKEARRSRKRDRFWPEQIARRPCYCHRAPAPDYLEDLVRLVVLVLEHPTAFRSETAKADWFGVSRRNWSRLMEQPFNLLAARAAAWHQAALDHIEWRLKMQRRDRA